MTTQGRADTLAETLLTMDVVDQLRHRDDHLRQLAAKGLDDADLKRRLTEIYRSQGIEVTDAILDAGIAAQRERRYVYRAPEGFAARLAGIWIDRGAVGKKAARALGAVAAAFVLFHLLWTLPYERVTHKRIEAINAQAAAIPGRIKVAIATHQRVAAALAEALDQARESRHSDRLQPMTTLAAAQARTQQQVVDEARAQLSRLPPLAHLVRNDGETRLVLTGQTLPEANPEASLRAAVDVEDKQIARITEATTALRGILASTSAAIDASRLLDVANAAALASNLPSDADALRNSTYAQGDTALRANNVKGANAAADRLNRLPADVAMLSTLHARLDALRRDALATRATGVDLATFDAAYQRAIALASITTVDQASAATEEASRLVDVLSADYTYRIVNRPGERSGVWRINSQSPDARNYYLIVEAIGSDGKAMPLPIRNEETGKTDTVTTFGLRVPEDQFDRVGRDKKDNGIIERDRVGAKPRGTLNPVFDIPVSGGYITAW